ncbi:MAG: patatin-like phospholipase family protein [Gammaproteobacteria bacterium]
MHTIRGCAQACSLLLALLFGLSTAELPAAQVQRPRVALVLSGGGAKGAAHVGVIRVLERLGVPVDIVVGTSMGAIVGGLYASGLSGESLDEAIREIDWTDIFDDDPPRAERSLRRKRDDADFLVRYRLGIKDGEPQLPRGVLHGQKLTLALRKLSAGGATPDFDRMTRRFRAVAADLETGDPVVLDSGSLALAMRASMSVPGVFPPVEYGGRLLIDGGIANNMPIDVARSLGADIIIAVNVQTDPRTREQLKSVINVVEQTINLLILRETKRQLASLHLQDVLIEPALGDIGSGDFLRAAEAIELGESAALARIARLEAIAALGADSPRATASSGIAPQSHAAPIISAIRIDNNTPLADEVLTSRLRARVGERLDLDKLEHDISRIYGLGHFETVDYQLSNRGGETELTIIAQEKYTGLNSLRFGLNLESDLAGESSFNIGLSYDLSALNGLGAEWRNELVFGDELKIATEFYQPLDYASRWFVEPQASYEEEDISVFEDGSRLAEVRVKTARLGVDFGREFGTCCEARAGVRLGHGRIERTTGTLALPFDEFDVGQFSFSFIHDTLDSVRFPRDGEFIFVSYVDSNEALGSDSAARLVESSATAARSWGPNTIFGQIRVGVDVEDRAQVQDLFSLGGFLNLSGFNQNELSGPNFAFGALAYYRQISDFGGGFGVPIYVGGSIEYGGVYADLGTIESDESFAAGSLFLGADTPIGPLYLGLGMAEGGNRAAYLFLGRSF